jgi:hypothetical protein
MDYIIGGNDMQYAEEIGIRTQIRGGPDNVFGVVVARQPPTEHCRRGRYQVVTDNGRLYWMEDLVLRGPDFEILEKRATAEQIEKMLLFAEAEQIRKGAEKGGE